MHFNFGNNIQLNLEDYYYWLRKILKYPNKNGSLFGTFKAIS